MKLTETVIQLMFELSNVDGIDHSAYLDGTGDALRSNLIKLYSDSDNANAHDLIVEIMEEAGYPWFRTMVRPAKAVVRSNSYNSTESISEDKLMSDNEFMDLLPINGHIH